MDKAYKPCFGDTIWQGVRRTGDTIEIVTLFNLSDQSIFQAEEIGWEITYLRTYGDVKTSLSEDTQWIPIEHTGKGKWIQRVPINEGCGLEWPEEPTQAKKAKAQYQAMNNWKNKRKR